MAVGDSPRQRGKFTASTVNRFSRDIAAQDDERSQETFRTRTDVTVRFKQLTVIVRRLARADSRVAVAQVERKSPAGF
jgi:hypothetical protein